MKDGSKNQRLALMSIAKYMYESRIITEEEYAAIKKCVKLKRTNNIDKRLDLQRGGGVRKAGDD